MQAATIVELQNELAEADCVREELAATKSTLEDLREKALIESDNELRREVQFVIDFTGDRLTGDDVAL